MVSDESDKKGTQVEVLPGIEVSKAQIDAAVAATSNPTKATLKDEELQRYIDVRKVLYDKDLREAIDVSKQVVKAIYDQAGKPEPRCINVDSLPPLLKRTVVSYVNMREAQEEYAEAVRELASKASGASGDDVGDPGLTMRGLLR